MPRYTSWVAQLLRDNRAAHKRIGPLALGLLVALAGLLARPIQVKADDLPYRHYFPIVSRQYTPCRPSAIEQTLASLMISDPQQRRPTLRCNARLEQAAQSHAADMAARSYVSYVTPEGVGMNDLVRQAGYTLPASYGTAPGANQVAAIAVGHETAQVTWAKLIDPEYGGQPRTFLLGLDPFFARQVEFGIGYVSHPGSPYGHYWVIIIAEPALGAIAFGAPAPSIERIVLCTP